MGLFEPLGFDYFLFHIGEIFNYNLFTIFVIPFLFLFLLLLLSGFSHVRLCATPQMAARPGPLSLGFSRKNIGVGCHFLLHFFWDPYNLNVGAFDIVPEVSETILSSFHFFLLYSALQKLFPSFYLPAHWFIFLFQILC